MAGIQSMITKHTKSSKIIQPIMGGGVNQLKLNKTHRMIELGNKDIKTVIITIFHVFLKLTRLLVQTRWDSFLPALPGIVQL